MNVLATQRGSAHYPSMLEDVEARRPTEIDLITGALVREAERHGVPVPAAHGDVPARQGEGGVVVRIRVQRSSAPGGVMTARKTGVLAALLAALAVVAAVAAATAPAATVRSDRDRLGVRRQGRDGAVRRSGARRCPDSRQAGQRKRRRQRAPAPDRHVRHAGQQARDREGVRGEAARPGRRRHLHRPATSTSRHRSCRRRSTAACSRSRRASAPIRWARSASARRAGSPSASATSRRTRARRWRSTRGARAGRPPPRHGHRASSTSRTSCRRSRPGSTQLGGKIVGRGDVPVARRRTTSRTRSRRLNGDEGRRDRHRRPPARSARSPPIISGLRTLGNNTPILNSWAGDGTYWLPKSPQVTNYYFVTYASIFGDDPVAGDQQAREAGQGRHRRLRHGLGCDRRRRRPRSSRAGGSTNGRPRSPRRWRSSRRCRRCRASSASRRSCTRCSAGSTA